MRIYFHFRPGIILVKTHFRKTTIRSSKEVQVSLGGEMICKLIILLLSVCYSIPGPTGLCLIYKEMGKQGDKTQKFCFKSSEEGPHVPHNKNRFPPQCPLQWLRNQLLCRCFTINPGYLCLHCWHQWPNCPPGSIVAIGSSIGSLGSKNHHFSLFTYISDITYASFIVQAFERYCW